MRLNIGPRLTLCFALIILSVLAGDAVVLWQFHIIRAQAERLDHFDRELAAVLRVHTSLLAFHDRLEMLADSKDTGRLVAEAGPLHTAVLEDTQRARNALTFLPSDIQRDPTILPTLEVIQGTLPSQLDVITGLANAGDWEALRLRLANQVHPLESLSSTLVEKVDREVGEEQAQAEKNIQRVQRRIFVIVPITVALTLLIAATLGLAITRSITWPLARLVEGSNMLARGDFQHQVLVSGEDELAQLGRVFNDTARQLRDLYANMQSSEDRLRRVIDTIPAYVWSTLPNGSVDFINQRLLEFTGLRAKDLLGRGWHSVFHPDDLPRYLSAWRVAVAAGETMESEVRVRGAGHDYRWLLIRKVPLRDGQGTIVKWYGTGIEIDDRKRVEEQLRRSEAYLAEAQRLSRTGSFGWEISTGDIYWSDETYQIFGYDRADKPGLEWILERTHPGDRDFVQQILEQAARHGANFDAEHRLLMPDGSVKYLHVLAHGLTDSSGNLEFVGAVTDVTAARQAEEALRNSEEQWRDVFENNPTMYFMVDAAGSIVAVNPFGAEQLGYDMTELIGRPVLNVFCESDREAVQKNVACCFEQLGRARSWEARKMRKDGKLLRVRETAKAVTRASGPIVLIACEDITEQKNAEEALRRAQADLARVNRVTTMGELTASLAHEVNQPIAAAVTDANTCLRWLMRDRPDLDEARQAALRIIKDSQRAADIIGGLRLLFQKGSADREPVDVNDLVREMVVLLRNEATRYAISVRTGLAKGLPRVTGDRVQLQQVLMNLMMNGIEAMKDMDGTRQLTISSQRTSDEQVLISVEDTGVGLPPHQSDQIFDAFFSTKPHGTGMGLRISRSIIESHSGRLWAADNPPRGAGFHFTLPTRVH